MWGLNGFFLVVLKTKISRSEALSLYVAPFDLRMTARLHPATRFYAVSDGELMCVCARACVCVYGAVHG